MEKASEIEALDKIAANFKALNDEVSEACCANDMYAEKSLNEVPYTTFRFIIKDFSLSKSQDAFENKVNEEFKKSKLDKPDQSFLISHYEQFANESKFYMKVRTNENVFNALRKMKTSKS